MCSCAGVQKPWEGEDGLQAERVMKVARSVADATGLPLEFVDERLSSREAKRILREQGLSEREMRGKWIAWLRACFSKPGSINNNV